MNCKQGDLAVFVRSEAGNEGKIVRCVRLNGLVPYWAPNGGVVDRWQWETDTYVVNAFGQMVNVANDDYLRPIRDPGDDAQDETLQWLDVPSKETV